MNEVEPGICKPCNPFGEQSPAEQTDGTVNTPMVSAVMLPALQEVHVALALARHFVHVSSCWSVLDAVAKLAWQKSHSTLLMLTLDFDAGHLQSCACKSDTAFTAVTAAITTNRKGNFLVIALGSPDRQWLMA